MSDIEIIRANAMLAELKSVINGLVDRGAVMAAEMALLRERIKELEAKKQPEKP